MDAKEHPDPENVTHRFAAIVRLTEDDPGSHLEAGSITIRPGRCADGTSHTVYADGEFYEVDCEVLGLLRADTEMSQHDLKRWAAATANEMNFIEKHRGEP